MGENMRRGRSDTGKREDNLGRFAEMKGEWYRDFSLWQKAKANAL